jgi:hypothetical protein
VLRFSDNQTAAPLGVAVRLRCDVAHAANEEPARWDKADGAVWTGAASGDIAA